MFTPALISHVSLWLISCSTSLCHPPSLHPLDPFSFPSTQLTPLRNTFWIQVRNTGFSWETLSGFSWETLSMVKSDSPSRKPLNRFCHLFLSVNYQILTHSTCRLEFHWLQANGMPQLRAWWCEKQKGKYLLPKLLQIASVTKMAQISFRDSLRWRPLWHIVGCKHQSVFFSFLYPFLISSSLSCKKPNISSSLSCKKPKWTSCCDADIYPRLMTFWRRLPLLL